MDLSLKPKRLGNVYLREIEESDYMDYFELGSDAKVCRYLNWGPFQKPYEALWAIRNIFLERPKYGLPVGYAITMDGKMIGMIDFHTINSKENSIEIGYVLNQKYWGLGIMKKCLSYMSDLAFSMGYSKVVLGSFSENVRSIHLIEKSGFHYEYETMAERSENEYLLARYYAKYKSEVLF